MPKLYDMGDSYFELLTGQQGFPAKAFDPLEEIRRIRRNLDLRLKSVDIKHAELHTEVPSSVASHFVAESIETIPLEPVAIETVTRHVAGMKRTLSMWQRSRSRSKTSPLETYRGVQKRVTAPQKATEKNVHTAVEQYIAECFSNASSDLPQEVLEKLNAGFIVLGMVGIFFGSLVLLWGWSHDLSFGSTVCLSGASIVAVGLGGHFLASRMPKTSRMSLTRLTQ